MKKTLVGLMVLAASGAAFAQSAVTVYGTADLAIAKANGGGKVQMTGNDVSNNGNSRIGFKGTEDLGSGLKASFALEAGVNLEDGSTNTSLFQRAANLSLSGGFGEVKVGRGLSLGHASAAVYDVTGLANYSTVGNSFGLVGGTRNNSELRYTSPEVAPGLKLAVGYVLAEDNLVGAKAATGSSPAVDGVATSKMDLAAMYANGPIFASAVFSKPTDGEKSYALGGGYSFGTYKVAASYQDPAGMGKGFTVGAAAEFGSASVAVDIARDTELKATNYVAEGKYSLSKRTSAYAAYQRFGATSTSVLSAGVRHNF